MTAALAARFLDFLKFSFYKILMGQYIVLTDMGSEDIGQVSLTTTFSEYDCFYQLESDSPARRWKHCICSNIRPDRGAQYGNALHFF